MEGRGKKPCPLEGTGCDAGMMKPQPTRWGPQEQILPNRVEPHQGVNIAHQC